LEFRPWSSPPYYGHSFRAPRQNDPIAEFARPDCPLAQGPGRPAGVALLLLLALGYVGANAVLAFVDGPSASSRAPPLILASARILQILLALTRHSRLPQTLSAVFGTYMLLAPAMAVLILMRSPASRTIGLAPDQRARRSSRSGTS
jgi:hypothetical protein